MGPIYAGDATTLEILVQTQVPSGDFTVEVDLIDETYTLSVSVVEAIVVLAPAVPAPISPLKISGVVFTPKPSMESVQFVEIGVQIANSGEAVAGARLTLHARRDGDPVEDYALASSLSLPVGTTNVVQRYIPASGWQEGAYAFSLTLETVDSSTEVSRTITTREIETTVIVP